MQRYIEPPNFLIERATEITRLLAYVQHAAFCPRERFAWDVIDAGNHIAFIEKNAPASQDTPFRMRSESLTDLANGTRENHVVGIEPKENVAGGSGKAPSNRVGLPTIFFSHPEIDVVRITFNDVARSISASSIKDEKLVDFIPLAEHRFKGRFEVGRLIKAWRDDAYSRQLHLWIDPYYAAGNGCRDVGRINGELRNCDAAVAELAI